MCGGKRRMGVFEKMNTTPEQVNEALNAARDAAAENKGRSVLTVGQLNAYIKQLIDSDKLLANVYIKGEISNFTNHYKTGHFYFTLKDEEGVIAAVMFKSAASKLKFMPENGMKVIARGRVSSYVKSGQYQIYCEAMEPDGIGSLYIAYEQLKRKREAEGLFSPARKKPLPKIPLRIGIITSPTGAAVRDMIQILGRRFPLAEPILYPALVQGSGAPESLIAGLRCFAAAVRAFKYDQFAFHLFSPITWIKNRGSFIIRPMRLGFFIKR